MSQRSQRATLTGHILEDEEAVGTAHLAFGKSASFGRANVSNVHIDGVLVQPTIGRHVAQLSDWPPSAFATIRHLLSRLLDQN